jgi:hypothetical protein
MEPSPSPYITHTGGPSHVNVVAGTEDEAIEAIRTVLEATARQGKHGRTWCTNPDCPEHGSDVDTESITSSASSECDDPDCTEHGTCQVSGEEEDVVKLLSQAKARNDNNNTITSEDSLKENLKEIEKMIEDAGETGTDEDEEKSNKTLMGMIDQMIDSLANSEASEELTDLAKELCKVVNSIASVTAGVVQMIINHESEIAGAGTPNEPRPSTSMSAGAMTPNEPRPSTSKSADANYLIENSNSPLRVRAHRIGVWVRKVTREANRKKEEAEADIKEVERKIK